MQDYIKSLTSTLKTSEMLFSPMLVLSSTSFCLGIVLTYLSDSSLAIRRNDGGDWGEDQQQRKRIKMFIAGSLALVRVTFRHWKLAVEEIVYFQKDIFVLHDIRNLHKKEDPLFQLCLRTLLLPCLYNLQQRQIPSCEN